MWHWKRLKESHQSLMGRLVLIANGASLDKVGGILFQRGPPEALEKDVAHLLGTQMAGEFRGMGPLQNPRPQGLWDIQAVWGTGARTRLTLGGKPHPLLHVPGQGGNETGRRKDCCRPLNRILTSLELQGQGIRLGIGKPRKEGAGEVKPNTERDKQTCYKLFWQCKCFLSFYGRSKPTEGSLVPSNQCHHSSRVIFTASSSLFPMSEFLTAGDKR